MFLLIKFDHSEKVVSLQLLRYYLLRDKESKKIVKELAKMPKFTKAKIKGVKYNLLDISLKLRKEKLAAYLETSNRFMQKVISNNTSLFGIIKGNGLMNNSLFDANAFTLLYALACFTQLLHYEILGISSYSSLPKEADLEKFRKDLKNPTEKFQAIIHLLQDILKYKAEKNVPDIFCEETAKYIEAFDLPSYAESSVVRLDSVYSILDMICYDEESNKIIYSKDLPVECDIFQDDPVLHEDFSKLHKEAFISFQKSIRSHISSLVDSLLKSSNFIQCCQRIAELILKSQCATNTQPYLLYFTTQNFKVIDLMIQEKIHTVEMDDFSKSFFKDNIEQQRFAEELETHICQKFGYIPVPKYKIERDELREEFGDLAGVQYNKLKREQEREVGVLYNKAAGREHKKLFMYISSKYEKLLNRCQFYKDLKENGRLIPNINQEFIELDVSRDYLLRSQRLKRLNNAEEMESLPQTYSYLRHFFLKKLMISTISGKSLGNFYSEDFQFPLSKRLFGLTQTITRKFSMSYFKSPDLCYCDSPKTMAIEESPMKSESEQFSLPPTLFDEYIPKSKYLFA